ncbi:MAG: flagellar biosynthetic protein FliO [Pseudomonadota bacterium]
MKKQDRMFFTFLCVFAVSSLWSHQALAASAVAAGETPSLALALVKMIFALIMVIGLLLLALHGIRRFRLLQERTGSGDIIKVIATRGLAPRKFVSVLEVGGETIVIGMSETGISLLTKIENGRIPEGASRSGATDMGESPDKERLSFLANLTDYSRKVRGLRPW